LTLELFALLRENFAKKLYKKGNYLWHKIYWSFITPYYNLSRCFNFLQYNDSTFVICNNVSHAQNSTYSPQNYGHPKWLFIDSLGNIKYIHEINTSPEDVYSSSNTFVKTINKSIIYGGVKGVLDTLDNKIVYNPQITMIDSNLNKVWRINLSKPIKYSIEVLKQIIAVNNKDFVVVGHGNIVTDNDSNSCGMLVKFNINGELLWQRKYVKVPTVPNSYWPTHELYDVDITPDSGFVMVGQAVNYNQNTTEQYGQLGWLVKTDKYGCLVPNCQQYDNPIDTTQIPPIDSTEIIEPAELYPNPTSHNLYYYHLQGENTSPFTCYIYNMQSQIVQQFTVSADKVTYIIDVSQLASGTYIFKVVSTTGEVVRSSKFVKVK
jgi:hypothetical protein